MNRREDNRVVKNMMVGSIVWVLILCVVAPLNHVLVGGGRTNRDVFGSLITSADSPISVIGNLALAGEASRGNGTLHNPFVIENHAISLNATGYCMYIQDTNAYLIINRSTLIGGQVAIYLFNCSRVTMTCNNVSGSGQGIFIMNSDNCSAVGNIVTNSQGIGISLFASEDCEITGNRATNNKFGISADQSHDSIISENVVNGSVTSAISVISSSSNITVFGNTIGGGNLGIDIGSSNTCTILENEVRTTSTYGLGLQSCSGTTISRNSITFNTGDGMAIYDSTGSVVKGNRIEWNDGPGIYIGGTGSGNHEFRDNIIHANDEYGIYLTNAENNTFVHNALWGNVFGNIGIASTTGNAWDNGSRGNYWGDYIARYPAAVNDGVVWNTPYTISSESDNFPLAFNPLVQPEPPALAITTPSPSTSTTVELAWNLVAGADNYTVYRYNAEITPANIVQATVRGTVSGTTFSDTVPGVGTYWYAVVATNRSGSSPPSNSMSIIINDKDETIDGYDGTLLPVILASVVCILLGRGRRKMKVCSPSGFL
jgi:parallel beta-helix repeat protein